MLFVQGMEPDLTLLHGEVLVSGEQLEAFSAASLPTRAAERFAVLFAHRQQWAADDLKPYIAGLEVSACIWPCVLMLIQHVGCHSGLANANPYNFPLSLAGTRAIYRVFAAEIHTRHAA